MIQIKTIGSENRQDLRIPNEPFPLFGRLVPACTRGEWSYEVERFSTVTHMVFPEENYDYDALAETCVFLGAYDGEQCVGLAILRDAPFRHMYLYELKVNAAYRGQGVAKALIRQAEIAARDRGYLGLYTVAQDNNLGACLFYLNCGFRIGGFDTRIYDGTKQEGKSDIYFYKKEV